MKDKILEEKYQRVVENDKLEKLSFLANEIIPPDGTCIRSTFMFTKIGTDLMLIGTGEDSILPSLPNGTYQLKSGVFYKILPAEPPNPALVFMYITDPDIVYPYYCDWKLDNRIRAIHTLDEYHRKHHLWERLNNVPAIKRHAIQAELQGLYHRY